MIPGTYDLYFQGVGTQSDVSDYRTSLLQTGVVVGTTPQTLTRDVPITTVSGTVTVNGAKVTSTLSGVGRLILQNATTYWPFASTNYDPFGTTTSAGTYSTPIIPGTYDLYYKVVTVGPGVPSNALVKLGSGVVIAGTTQTLNIDIPATTVTGTITVNGAQVDSSMGTGGLHLRNAEGDDALVGTTATAGAYSQLVVAGTYDLYYEVVTSGAGVLSNQLAKLRTGIVVGGAPLGLDIDVAAPKVSGMLSQNGTPYPVSGNPIARLYLETASGDKALIGNTFTGMYAAYVIAGTYDLVYDFYSGELGIPYNTTADLGCYGVP